MSVELWAAHGDPAPLRLLAFASGIGLLGALILRPDAAGAAHLILGTAVLGAAFGFRARRISLLEVVTAAAACGLLVAALIRSASWLVELCFVGAGAMGTLALVGGRTWTGVLVASVSSGLVPLRVVRWAGRSVAAVHRPAVPVRRIALVSAVSAGAVLLFGILFATADSAYAGFLDDLAPTSPIQDLGWRFAALVVVALGTLTAAFLAQQPPAVDLLAPGPGRPVRNWEWLVPLALVDLLFMSFVAVQLTVLFGGRDHVLRTAGLTYAEYARHGFWQLLVVTLLALVVMAVAVRTAPPNRLLVRALLGLLCLLSLVIVASAVDRMSLYEQEYGFTRLRVFIDAVELALGLVFVLLLVAGVRMDGAWLPRAVLGLAAAFLLALIVVNPDAYIARHNIDRFQSTHRIDIAYLAGLSADAVPELDRLPERLRNCALAPLAASLESSSDPWYDANLARSRARRLLAERPLGQCSG